MKCPIRNMILFTLTLLVSQPVHSADIKVVAPWQVQVTTSSTDPPRGGSLSSGSAVLVVQPPEPIEMESEYHESLPVFNPNTAGWGKGVRLFALRASETTTPYLLDRDSIVVRAGEATDSTTYKLGEDYQADLDWGTVGRLADGKIPENTPVYVSYRYTPQRLDAVVLNRAGEIELRQGNTRESRPRPPMANQGERQLGHIYIPGPIEKLESKHIFPIIEARYPEPKKVSPSVAEQLVPKSLKKLQSGAPLKILAWGDSVTVGTFLDSPKLDRWQNQVATRLRERFPQAKIELVTEAWGGRNTGAYLAEPPGSPHNYQEKVLDVKPDLVISEFVNDAGLSPAQVEERYSKLLADFKAIGAEWVIFTPHYVRPDWMGLDREREIDDDPRPYVDGIRQFGKKHQIAVADASLRWGHLWRQGIPYTTLLVNSINHPDEYGMQLFADALMELFP